MLVINAGATWSAPLGEHPPRVLNIGSIDGIRVPAFESYAYSASKAAVHQLTRHLGAPLAHRHDTVNAIAPGLVPSAVYRASRAGAYTTGAVIPVDGGAATLR